jgi:predicted dehydrogenase
MIMDRITAVLVGAGHRGMNSYAPYALKYPNEIKFVAVAEPNEEKRERFSKLHGIEKNKRFICWEDLLNEPKLADAILICTQDRMHYQPAIKALEKGYHTLLEKPMSNDPKECVRIGEYARAYGRVFSICHVLRYTPFFITLKRLLDEGTIGKIISIQHNENVGHIHQSHSYVRGHWRNSEESSPMILSKSCHDMDILLWLVGADCTSVSSFGSLSYFISENAPGQVPERCLDGCPFDVECPYYAPKIYITGSAGWPAPEICNDPGIEAKLQALREGPFGRCVYHCDNNVVDHQVVNLEFDTGVTVAFTMCAFTAETSRTLKVMGEKGEIKGAMEKNEIEVIDFSSGNRTVIQLKEPFDGHAGGDSGIMRDFIRLIRTGGNEKGRTAASEAVQSHLMAFAAEKSRLEKTVINMRDYWAQMQS